MSNEQQSPIPFDVWWEESIVPVMCFADSQAAKTARNLCRLAWQKGAYHAMTGNLAPPTH